MLQIHYQTSRIFQQAPAVFECYFARHVIRNCLVYRISERVECLNVMYYVWPTRASVHMQTVTVTQCQGLHY